MNFFHLDIDLILSKIYVRCMKTFSLKKEEIRKKWVLIDAKNAILGRLASISESKLVNVTVVKEGMSGGTAATDKSVIVGAVPKVNTGST